MKHTIKNRWTGEVIFSADCETLRDCVEAANLSRANLSGANLSGADLSRANLSGANLSGADLSGANLYRANLYRANLSRANLSRANLSGANLSGANLYRANLYRANLSGADLSGADLSGANLSRANLSGANLYRADLSGANLSGANLYRAMGVNKHRIDPLRLLAFQVGKIRAFKLVAEDYGSPIQSDERLFYRPRDVVSAKANTNEQESCACGVNLCSLPWALQEMDRDRKYRIMLCEFSQKDLACIPFNTDGKFRVHACRVVREITPDELGLDENWQEPNDEKE